SLGEPGPSASALLVLRCGWLPRGVHPDPCLPEVPRDWTVAPPGANEVAHRDPGLRQ
ncbi:unnamed protein product, partial [Effrenium voratum]